MTDHGTSSKASHPVNVWAILFGLLLALFAGFWLGLAGGMFGMIVTNWLPKAVRTVAVTLVGTAIPLVAMGCTWYGLRQSRPNFAKGFLIGSCIAVLLIGICNSSLGSF